MGELTLSCCLICYVLSICEVVDVLLTLFSVNSAHALFGNSASEYWCCVVVSSAEWGMRTACLPNTHHSVCVMRAANMPSGF